MRLILGPLLNPAAQERFLVVAELLVKIGRRHHFILVVREDALPGLAGSGVFRHDGRVSAEISECPVARIKPQIGLPFLRVKTVAGKAGVGEDRPDVPIE